MVLSAGIGVERLALVMGASQAAFPLDQTPVGASNSQLRTNPATHKLAERCVGKAGKRDRFRFLPRLRLKADFTGTRSIDNLTNLRFPSPQVRLASGPPGEFAPSNSFGVFEPWINPSRGSWRHRDWLHKGSWPRKGLPHRGSWRRKDWPRRGSPQPWRRRPSELQRCTR